MNSMSRRTRYLRAAQRKNKIVNETVKVAALVFIRDDMSDCEHDFTTLTPVLYLVMWTSVNKRCSRSVSGKLIYLLAAIGNESGTKSWLRPAAAFDYL